MPSRSMLARASLALLLGMPCGGMARAQGPILSANASDPGSRRPLERLDLVVAVAGGRDLSVEVGLLREALPLLPRMARALPGRVRLRYGLVAPSPRAGDGALGVVPVQESLSVLEAGLERLEERTWSGNPDLGLALERAFRELGAGDPAREDGPVGRHVLLVTDDAPLLEGAQIGEWFTFLQGAQENGIVLDVLAAPLVLHERERWEIWGTLTGITYGVAMPVPVYRSRARSGSMEIEVVDPAGGGTRRVVEEEGVVLGERISRKERAKAVPAFLEWTLRNLAASRKLVLDEEVFSALR